MMTPPRQRPRGGGRHHSNFRYSAEDVRCDYCTNFVRKRPCSLSECICLEERIEAGAVDLPALVQECFGSGLTRPLQARLRNGLDRQASIPVLEMIRQLQQLRQVYLCLDNDEAGHAASGRMTLLLRERGLETERLVPQEKDWNDDLIAEHKIKEEMNESSQGRWRRRSSRSPAAA